MTERQSADSSASETTELRQELAAQLRWIRLAMTIAGVLFASGIIVSAWAVYWFENSQEHLDQLGGFLAGTTGVLWAAAGLFLIFAAFVAQIRQSSLQEEEVRLNRIEIQQTQAEMRGQKEQLQEQSRTFRQQQFENTFFQLLALHHQIVNGIDRVETTSALSGFINPNKGETTREFRGRDVFVRVYRDLQQDYGDRVRLKGPCDLNATITEVYQRIYLRNQSDLGHYFRNLYTLVKFVHNSDVSDREIYTNIVRAQLSSHERLLLFYNGLSDHGKEKFKSLIERYHLLKNMPDGALLDPSHRNAYEISAFTRDGAAAT